MASFAITSKVNLVVSNLNKVSSEIRNKLESVTVTVNSNLDRRLSRDIQEINKNLVETRKATSQARDSMEDFGRQTALTIKRFGAYTLVTAGFFRFVSSVNKGIREAIDFQDQLIRIRQVTGESLLSLKTLNNEVDRLSIGLGVSSKELLSAAQVLAQAGLNAKDVRVSLQALAKSDLAPTFDNINKTAEASIAILRQFGLQASELESKLSSINAVSAKFAVESGDITAAIQTTGGAFAAAGGNLEELISLFTSVRATTRESAASIATGFRTIFTRIQRSRTQDFLSGLGIELKEFGEEARRQGREGLFVGPFEAVRRLSQALNQLNSADPRFAQVIEELGGFRQISKVIPLIQQFSTAENALGVAIRGTNSLTEDAEKRQESLAIQLTKLREEFQALLREIGDSEGFKAISAIFIQIAQSALQLSRAIEPLLTLLPILFGGKVAQSGQTFLQGFSKSSFKPMAKGGMIAGTGNKDSELIAAMPGEFVVKKSSVKKYGPEFLGALNEGKINKFASGGLVGATAGLGAGAALLGSQTGLFGDLNSVIANFSTFGLSALAFGAVLKSSSTSLEKFANSIQDIEVKKIERLASVREGERDLTANRVSRFKIEGTQQTTQDAFDANQQVIKFERQGIIQLKERKSSLKSVIEAEKKKLAIEQSSGRKVKEDINFIRSKDIGPQGDAFIEAELKRLDNIKEGIRARLAKIGDLDKQLESTQSTIDFKQERVKPLISEKSKLSERLTLGEASLKERDAEARILQEKIEAEKKVISIYNERQKAEARQIRNTENLNKGLAIAGAGLLALSSFLDKIAQKELDSLRSGDTFNEDRARRSFVASRGASGGATGAFAGLGLARLASPALGAGPAGAVALLGGLALGLYQAKEGLKDFETQVKLINLEEASSNLTTLLSSLEKGSGVGEISVGINKQIREFSSSLATEQDKAVRDSLNSTIESNTSALLDFVKKATAASISLRELDNIVSSNVQQLLADRTNKTLAQYRKELKETIDFQRRNNESLEKAIKINRDFEISVLSQRALNTAATAAADSLLFLSDGASQIFSGQGVNFNPRTTGVFSQISGGSADNNTSSILNSFAKNFGDAASLLAQESLSAADAIKILPNILLEIRSSEALGGTGNFLTRLGQSLDDAGIGKGISDIIVAKATDIIGPEGKDSIILDKLNKEFLSTLDEFISNLTDKNQKIFTELESATIANLKQFSEGLATANKVLDGLIDRQTRQVDNQRVLQDVISSITGRTNFGAERRLDQTRTNIITGGRSADQLINDLRNAISSEGQLRDQLGQTQDLEQQKRLVSAINSQQQAASRAAKGLDELANVSARTSTAQKQLADATKDRLTRRDLAIQTITASPRELAEQRRTIELSRFAVSQSIAGGDVTKTIKPEDLKSVVAFLQSLGGTKIGALGGLSGNDALDKIIAAQLGGANIPKEGILTPGKDEVKLLDEIRKAVQEANRIESERAKTELAQGNAFVVGLGNNFNKFISDLKTQIDRIFENERQTRSDAIRGDISTKTTQQETAERINNITGINPQTVLANFKQITDLVNKTRSTTLTKDNISSLLNDPNVFRRAVGAVGVSGDLTGTGLLKNLFSQVKDKDTFETLNKTLREGGFNEVIAKLDNFINRDVKTALLEGRNPFASLKQDGLQKQLESSLNDPLKNIIKNLDKELLSLGISRSEIGLGVGGEQNLTIIEKSIAKLTPLIAKFPEGTRIDQLSGEIAKLNQELSIINSRNKNTPNPLGRNSGGMIPGYGTKDTVPAMLTKGEYVVKAPSVRKYGKGMMDQINSGNFQGFNRGGIIGKANFPKKDIGKNVLSKIKRPTPNQNKPTTITDIISGIESLVGPLQGFNKGGLVAKKDNFGFLNFVDLVNQVTFGKRGYLNKFIKFAEADIDPALLDITNLLGFSPPKVRDIGVGAFGDPEIHSLMYDSARDIMSNLRQQQGLTLKEQREKKLLDSGLPFPSPLTGNFTGLSNEEAQALNIRRARQANQAMYDFNVVDRGDGGLGGNYYKDEVRRIKQEMANRSVSKYDLSDSKESIKLISDPNVIKNITKEQLQVFASKFKFPQSIMDDLVKYGVSVKQSGSVTNIDKDLLTKSPRGQSGTFDDIKGLYRNATKQIFLRNDAKPEVLIHELGHAFDYFKGTITDQNDFIASYGSDVQRMPQVNKDQIKYLLQEGSAGRRETFATIFDDIIRKRDVMKGYFPSTTELVSDLMKKSEIEHLHQDYKDIVSARNVENPNYKMLLEKIQSSKAKIQNALTKDDPRVQKFLTQLNTAEALYSKRAGFNRGGFVGGIGNGDSVNAKLTPGEYVMNKGAVQKYGANFFSSLNSQKFANGGQVQPNINTDFMNSFNSAISKLSTVADRLSQSFANIPSEITMRATHRVEVIHNGAQVFAQIEPGLMKLVEQQTNKAINNMIMKKFPEVGVMD